MNDHGLNVRPQNILGDGFCDVDSVHEVDSGGLLDDDSVVHKDLLDGVLVLVVQQHIHVHTSMVGDTGRVAQLGRSG